MARAARRETPKYTDLNREWDLYVFGEVDEKRRFTWAEFSALPRVLDERSKELLREFGRINGESVRD